MTAAVFVDTNVLVYARDARNPSKQMRAAPWLDLLWHDRSCMLLLSEDLQDGSIYGGVTVRSPFSLSVGEPTAAYVSTPRAAGTHPRRGRPARATRIAEQA